MPPACPCTSGQSLADCCGRYHAGTPAPSAEQLMRSRYSAYVLGLIDYLVATTLPAQQPGLDRQAMAAWRVTFTARWHDAEGDHSHRERSAFVQHDGRWYFIDPTVPLQAGRNDPCPCGSGVKFKKCCAAYL